MRNFQLDLFRKDIAPEATSAQRDPTPGPGKPSRCGSRLTSAPGCGPVAHPPLAWRDCLG